MKNKQESALRDSILNWELNLLAVKTKILPKIGSDVCPCCIEFKECVGCPIAEYSDEVGCENTPYESVLRFYVEKEKIDWEQLEKAVKSELKFLKKVLKKHK